ncbi:hypothetical protein TBLA_0E01490 [Henningerozyma blattae CBS 6284]|uniref:Xaa-Pro aminopeptidase n=1 Tax=Henningerozyma blattae (strain ATCC 34711 / CBS 6284 / DSM 70876 / NBRC 10599 / NRRL Y-10934 / UCD 77-7) TaxID=1071380 RepID=I2H4A5_HENB6|nr:hypothetical protein TBLA_0E01490 [Tetrapisispora blattae CBS 6284]CCH61207.1 hypothetical protein TBLA_0E01490 [Tetrapisispora blattae CBS 6284]
MTTNLNPRPSMLSMGSRGGSRPLRPCDNCTCSPGLLSRQGRRSTLFMKQLENNRRRSSRDFSNGGAGGDGSISASVYSSDTLCQSTREINTTKRLLALRKQMIKHDLACYIIPSEDEHQSEYVSLRDQRRAFISGFSGSAGVACVTRDLLNFNENDPDGKCILSTDGRYFNQASQELDFNWTLLRQGEDSLTWQEWCIKEVEEMAKGLAKGRVAKIGIDPKLISFEQVKFFNRLIREKLGPNADDINVQFVAVEDNLIDLIWDKFENMPEKKLNDVFFMSSEYTGEDFQSKRKRLMQKFNKDYPGASKFVVVALDEICWLLNLRGSDIDYNPVFFAYLFFNNDETILFCDNPFTDESVKEYLSTNGVVVKPYGQVWKHLEEMSVEFVAELQKNKQKKEYLLLPDNCTWQIVRKIDQAPYKLIHSVIDVMKSVKNETEINNARRAQVKDAMAIIQYFAWLEDRLINHEALLDEYRAAEKLTNIRRAQPNFLGESFETISSTGANAAVIHYSPPKEGSSMIDPTKIYLCDSGSQFMEGTTDITRTLHWGKPSQEEIDNYTYVLKGNLALERLKFPEGTSGYQIDCLARQYLWTQGLDYKHGTGHGVGATLNVHEGPMGIGFRPHLVEFPLEAGNIITNEPGYYKDGEYGIRIENDMLVRYAAHLNESKPPQGKKFLEFENITMVPYCKKLINTKLLTEEERQQINAQHKRIWQSLVQLLQPTSIAHKWLKRETSMI